MSIVGKSWTRLNALAGVPQVRFHDLRHTAATLLLSRGVHPKVVSELLGHSTVAITLDVYSHVIPSMQREAAQVMDDLLGG
jgi:integrase